MLSRLLLIVFYGLAQPLLAQPVQIQIDILANRKPVSPFLYGRNNSLSVDPQKPTSLADLLRLKDAGIQFFRECTGNNATKYNWRRKLSSHPDWYNNVYPNNWDFAAQTLQANFPNAQGMWAFQLIGKAAKTQNANFNDWGYNQSQWWQGVNQNLAGGGTINTLATATKALKDGDPNAYLENWPADSTVGLLDHWFSPKGLGLNKARIQYWNMDNEAEIWSGTHDDIMPQQLPANDFIQRYVAVAQKARAAYPAIKLVGPVTANEWQWFNYDNKTVTDASGQKYPWLEFFIKRIGEEQKRTGIRLLDVLDIHFYPGSTKAEEVVQYHRVFFDRTYAFPEANGIRTMTGGYDTSLNKEYIFGRCREWLDKYLGVNHGVTLGLTEAGLNSANNANVHAVWYASTLGEFMSNQVEIFTPWSWKPGMWEVLHLFSRYNKANAVEAISNAENLVSAYPTTNITNDSLTVVLVNRSTSETKLATINLKNFIAGNQPADMFLLANLPATETFTSHSNNALKKSSISVVNNSFSVSLPPLSVASIQLAGKEGSVAPILGLDPTVSLMISPNPSAHGFRLTHPFPGHCSVYDVLGRQIDMFSAADGQSFGERWPAGVYVAVFQRGNQLIKSVRLVKQ